MALSPLLIGRVPNSLVASRLIQNLQIGQQDVARLQEQLATGRQFSTPGQAPAPAVTTIAWQRLLERKLTAENNITVDRPFLTATDSALAAVSDSLNTAIGLAHSGIGDTAAAEEKVALADEVRAIIQGLVGTANTTFDDRHLFAGSRSDVPPFEYASEGTIRYNGDSAKLPALVDIGMTVNMGVDGRTAFGALSPPVSADLDPALTLETKLADLYGGAGVQPNAVTVTLDDGATSVSKIVDLSGARTIGDLKLRLEDAFSAEPLTLTVEVDPTSNSGLRITPSAGTVAIENAPGSDTATQLLIDGPPAAVVNGGDLDPALTIFTPLAALNNGAGIGPTAGAGLSITHAGQTTVVDLTSASTVGDVLNLLRLADPDLAVSLNNAVNGIAVSSRLSGAELSIGENGGGNAAALGIRTLTGETLLADLNLGRGVPSLDEQQLEIVRRDGTTVSIDLSGALTVQDVVDGINAVDPGNLTASLNAVGNGISLTDNSGAGPLTVVENDLSVDLGLAGSDDSGPAGVLVGDDPNPQQPPGVFSILIALEEALRTEDDNALTHLSGRLDEETDRVNLVRGQVGSRLRLLDETESRLKDQDILIQDSISKLFEADPAEVITRLLQSQQSLEASMQVASQILQLSILNFL